MSKVSITNISTANIVLSCNNINFRRDLAPRRTLTVDKEVFDELAFESGIQTMISYGFLKVTGDEEAVDAVRSEREDSILSYDEAKKVLEDKDYTKFTKIIKTAPQATKDNFVKAAIDLNVIDNGFTALIQKYCGVDVFKAIDMKRQTV